MWALLPAPFARLAHARPPCTFVATYQSDVPACPQFEVRMIHFEMKQITHSLDLLLRARVPTSLSCRLYAKCFDITVKILHAFEV